MKILIAYTTKYGATEICAKKLSDELKGECDLINLKEAEEIDIFKYDKVILGGSIYAGNSQSELRKFSLRMCNDLCKIPLGIYLSCMGFHEEAVDDYFYATFPKEVVEHATVIKSLGGIFNFKKMNFFERSIIKMIGRTEATRKGVKNILNGKQNINTISLIKIKQFAEDMNNIVI